MNTNEILKFLRELAEKDRQWQAEKAKDELYTAFRFNPFRFFRTDEMGLSAVLAFLLNPKETHGQRDYFLKSFLEYLNLHEYLAYDQVEVHTEKKFDGRPHDIVLIGKLKGKQHWIISIENKLNGAVDQKNQINDYLKSLEKEYIQHHLIYMPIWDNPPSKYSIIEEDWQKAVDENKASIFSAQRMIEWLENCIIISPRIQQFVADFSNYIKTEILKMSEHSNNEQLISEIIQKPEDIKILVESMDLAQKVQERLFNQLIEQLKEKSKQNGFQEWEVNTLSRKQESWIFFQLKSKFSEVCIELRFDHNDLYFGIYNKTNKEEYSKLFSDLLIKHNIKPSGDYLGWKVFPDNLRNWNGETFSKIPSGQLAKEIWEEIEPICKDILKKMEEYQK